MTPSFGSRKHKYNAKRTEFSGMSFPSRLEANTYGVLKLLEVAGEIKDIERYPSVELSMKCPCCRVVIETGIRYKPDFKIYDLKLNEPVWVEAKGIETLDWGKNLKLWRAGFGPGILRIYKARGKSLFAQDVVPDWKNASHSK